MNRFKLIAILLFVVNNVWCQNDFTIQNVTIFKTGVAQFEKETTTTITNKLIHFNKLPFTEEKKQIINNGYVANNKPKNNTNVIFGTINFSADNNVIQEIRVQPDHLKLVFAQNKKSQIIKVRYLQNGLMWIPTYNINLSDNQKGIITLNATILNNVEDIENANLRLAVGYPSFPYSKVKSPLSSKTTVSEMLQTIQTKQSYKSSNNDNIVIGYGIYKKSLGISLAVAQKDFEDLFFYEKKHFSIRKNEIVKITLLDFDVEYKDVYSTELTPSTKIIYNGYIDNSIRNNNKVAHSIQFVNSSTHPLTSGVVYFQKTIQNKIKYMFQGELKHTVVNDTITTDLSVTPEINVKDFDTIISKKGNGSNVDYTLKGVIDITNHKKETIEMTIKRNVFGVLQKSDSDWEFKSQPLAHTKYNTKNNVTWKVKVLPNDTRKITYTYNVTVE